jgi:hypothetical protein
MAAICAAGPRDGSPATLPQNSLSLVQNLVVMEGVANVNALVGCEVGQKSNLFIDMAKQDPGFVNKNGKTAGDYDLASNSPAINKGGQTDSVAQDFFGRSVPDTKTWTEDVGACEYGSSGPLPPFFPGAAEWIGAPGRGGQGGAGGAGGASSGATGTGGTGGTSCPATGGVVGTGGAGQGGTQVGTIPASETAVWQQFHPSRVPAARDAFAMAYHPGTQKTYVFGGMDPDSWRYPASYAIFSDLWAWDGKTWTQVTTAKSPPARAGSAMAYDPTRKSLILFGGGTGFSMDSWQHYDTLFDDTWEWTENQGWAELKPASKPLVGTGPGPANGVAMFTDTTRSKLLLWAGDSMSTNPDDPRVRCHLWEWDGAAMTWTKRAPVADASELAWIGPLAYDEGRQKLLFIEPQSAASPTSFSEWDPVTAGFTKGFARVSLGTPAWTTAQAAAYDSIRRRMVVLTEWPTDTWELDSQSLTWYHRALCWTLGEVFATSMVFDSARGVVVAFGESEPTNGTVINVLAELKVGQLDHGEGCTASTATSCASGFCVEGVCCDVAACTGACRSCGVPGSEGTCAPAPAGTPVPGSCADGLACDPTGACLAKNGRTCSRGNECASGFCADGVCCESACTGKCVACNLAGQAGRCRPHPEGADPEAECGDGTGACKSFCDGNGGCTYPANEVICGFCMTCDGYGACSIYNADCDYDGRSGAGGKADPGATGGAGGAGGRSDAGAGGVGAAGGSGGSQSGVDASASGGGGSGASDARAAAGGTSGGRDAATAADAASPKLTRSGCSCGVGRNSAALPVLAFLAVLGLLPWGRHRRPSR